MSILCVANGYDVDYQRVPVTDEKAPKERDFVFLVRRLWQQPPGTALVFNCQMGRGRTSTGMIIASLLHLRQHCHPFLLPTHPQGAPSPFLALLITPQQCFVYKARLCLPKNQGCSKATLMSPWRSQLSNGLGSFPFREGLGCFREPFP